MDCFKSYQDKGQRAIRFINQEGYNGCCRLGCDCSSPSVALWVVEVVMRKFLTVIVVFGLGLVSGKFFDGTPPRAEAGGGNPLPGCQDINGDGASDVSDAISFLSWRFLGGPAPSCPAGNAAPAGLTDTGQTKCYDAAGAEVSCDSPICPGQDGRHATGCPWEGRFIDNGDGTVTDRCTRLMWQKDTADVDGDGRPTERDSADWCDALAYCESLAFAGHEDWRLPSIRELLSLVDYGRFDPSIDPAFGGFPPYDWALWSSTSNPEDPLLAWGVRYAVGFDFGRNPKVDLRFVRAVRGGSCLPPCQDINGDGASDVSDAVFFLSWRFLGGPAPACQAAGVEGKGLPDTGLARCYDASGAEVPCESAACPGQDGVYATGCPSAGRFIDNGDGTVTDRCTSLMWQKDTTDLNGDGRSTVEDDVDWCAALAYCEGLSFAGHDDWRLPSVRELLSLVDYGRLDQAIDPVFGTMTPPEVWAHWSSTSTPEFPDNAWAVRYAIGYDVGGPEKVEGHKVRAVRSGP